MLSPLALHFEEQIWPPPRQYQSHWCWCIGLGRSDEQMPVCPKTLDVAQNKQSGKVAQYK